MQPTRCALLKSSLHSRFYRLITATKRGPDIAAYVRFTFFRRELWLFRSRVGRGRRLFLVLGLTLINNPDLRAESFVVGVPDDLSNMHVIRPEVQNVIRAGV